MPTSWVMRSARLSIRAPRASLTLVKRAVRSATGVADHAGNAARAACTAASISSAVPSGTLPITASVVESITSSDPWPCGSTQAPPMYSLSLMSACIGSMFIPP